MKIGFQFLVSLADYETALGTICIYVLSLLELILIGCK